jgi:hypothetical protein
MKNIILTILSLALLTSCSTAKEGSSVRRANNEEKRVAVEAAIKDAIESKWFIVKLDRVYPAFGGVVDLLPRANYIIIEGGTSRIRSAYMGRQYSFRPIAGINMKGSTKEYRLIYNPSKGKYEIHIKIEQNGNHFDLYLTVGRNGSCSASISGMEIDTVRYSGQLVPVRKPSETVRQESDTI